MKKIYYWFADVSSYTNEKIAFWYGFRCAAFWIILIWLLAKLIL